MTDQTFSFAPGDWFAVLGDRAAVFLPPTERSRVASLWDLVDGGGDFDEVLDALLAGGLRFLSGCLLLSRGEATTRVLIRGTPRATLDLASGETVEVDGLATTTWTERLFGDVVRYRLLFEDVTGSVRHTVVGGLVRVAQVDHPAYAAPAVAPTAAPERVVEPDPEPVVEPETVPQPVGEPEPDVTAPPVARLAFSHGETVDVDRAVLVGRAPEQRLVTSGVEPRLVTVPSPNHEISSTHLEVRPGSGADHGRAVVTDLGSTNGTMLVQPGFGPEALQPGVAVQLLPGALIDLGDGLTVQVLVP